MSIGSPLAGLVGCSVALRGPLQADSKKKLKKCSLTFHALLLQGKNAYIYMEDAVRVTFFNDFRH